MPQLSNFHASDISHTCSAPSIDKKDNRVKDKNHMTTCGFTAKREDETPFHQGQAKLRSLEEFFFWKVMKFFPFHSYVLFFWQVPEGEEQPTTDIDLFISTERLKIVNSSTKVRMSEWTAYFRSKRCFVEQVPLAVEVLRLHLLLGRLQ